jgi:hypothetical protein
LPLQSSWMSKTYLKSDHFNGGGSQWRCVIGREVEFAARKRESARNACLRLNIADIGKAFATQQFLRNQLRRDADAINLPEPDGRCFGRPFLRKRALRAN